MYEKRIIQIAISFLGFSAMLAHICFPDLKIDGITIFLIAIVIIPWLQPLFKSFELPGGLKIEYHQIEKATKKLEESGLIKPSDQALEKKSHSKYSFLNVVDIDSSLALMGFRMEIESRLKDLAVYNSIETDKIGINQITRKLVRHGILSSKESGAILDVLPILNNAAHGKNVNKKTHDWVIEIGPQILDNLEAKLGSQKLPELIEVYKNRDGGQAVEIGHELSKQLIKSTDSFFEIMKRESRVFKDWLNDLQVSTFTLFGSEDEIEEELDYAKYSKLKEMMIEKVESFLKDNKNNFEAISVLKKLKEIEIRSVW